MTCTSLGVINSSLSAEKEIVKLAIAPRRKSSRCAVFDLKLKEFFDECGVGPLYVTIKVILLPAGSAVEYGV